MSGGRRLRRRPAAEKRALLCRQSLVVAIHLLLQLCVWTLVLMVLLNSTTLLNEVKATLSGAASANIADTVATAVPALLVTVLNMIMPVACKILAKQTRWDNPQSTRYHMVGGYYFGRTLTLVLLFLSYYNLFLESNPDHKSAMPELAEARTTTYACPQDQFGNYLLIQSVTEFLIPKVSLLGERALNHFKVRVLGMKHKPKFFEVEKTVIHLIYFQALLWMLLPYFPIAALMGVLLLLLDFLWDKWFLFRFCAKSTTPVKSGLALFLAFYLLTLVIFSMAYAGLWLTHEPMCECFAAEAASLSGANNATGDAGETDDDVQAAKLGPFAEVKEAPMGMLHGRMEKFSASLSSVVDVLLTPYFFLGCLVLVLLARNLLRYRVGMLQAYHEEHSGGQQLLIMQLQAKLKQQTAQNGRLRRQSVMMRKSLAEQSSASLNVDDVDAGIDEEDVGLQ